MPTARTALVTAASLLVLLITSPYDTLALLIPHSDGGLNTCVSRNTGRSLSTIQVHVTSRTSFGSSFCVSKRSPQARLGILSCFDHLRSHFAEPLVQKRHEHHLRCDNWAKWPGPSDRFFAHRAYSVGIRQPELVVGVENCRNINRC